MGKAIILSRVSTLKQDLQQQTEEVIRFAAGEGYLEKDITLIEDKESAVKLDEEHRLGLIELKQKILDYPGLYDCVFAYEISRIGRRAEVNYAVRNFLKENKVQLIILKPYIKLFDKEFKIEETANMTFAIFNALAEHEGYIRKDRLARGKARKQKEGKYVGGMLPHGYAIGEDNIIVINDEKAPMVRKIFDDYVNVGKSTSVIGRELLETGQICACSISSAAGIVRAILKNVAYIGGKPVYTIYAEGKEYKTEKRQSCNHYPRLVSDEVFTAAQMKLKNNHRAAKTTHKHIYFCKGLIKDKRNGMILSPKMSTASYGTRRIEINGVISISIPINLMDSFMWHLTKEFHITAGTQTSRMLTSEMKEKENINSARLQHTKRFMVQLKCKERRIQERIVEGKLKESMGESMLETLYAQFQQCTNLINSLERDIYIQQQKISRLLNSFHANMTLETSDEEKAKYIQETISGIELVRYEKKKTGKKPAPTGAFVVTYMTGNTELYYYHSYRHMIWDKNMIPVEYEYIERFVSASMARYKDSKTQI